MSFEVPQEAASPGFGCVGCSSHLLDLVLDRISFCRMGFLRHFGNRVLVLLPRRFVSRKTTCYTNIEPWKKRLAAAPIPSSPWGDGKDYEASQRGALGLKKILLFWGLKTMVVRENKPLRYRHGSKIITGPAKNIKNQVLGLNHP